MATRLSLPMMSDTLKVSAISESSKSELYEEKHKSLLSRLGKVRRIALGMIYNIDIQYLTDKNGNKTAVIVPISDWSEICENMAEFDKYALFKTDLQDALREVTDIEKDNAPAVSLNEFLDQL